MNFRMLLLVAIPACLLSGCATPLNLDRNGRDAAAVIGLSSDRIKFIGYCGFATVTTSGDRTNAAQGLIALTDDSIVLLKGDLPGASVNQKIKYSSLRGVDVKRFGRARQLQVLQGSDVIVMEITRNKAMV